MAPPCFLGSTHDTNRIRVARPGAQLRSKSYSGFNLGTGWYALQLSTHLLGAPSILAQRTIPGIHARHPGLGRGRLLF